MLRPIFFVAVDLVSSCIKRETTSELNGVRVGNSKLVVCKYTHPHLGDKRVEHYALYEARRSGLIPLELDPAGREKMTTKERDIAFQKMVLDTIKDLDPYYHGMLEGMLESFDRGDNVAYEYANHIGDEEDQEEKISLPKDGFVDDAGAAVKYNPRYSTRLCDTRLLIYRKSKSVGENSFQVAMDRWDPTMDPDSLVPPSADVKALDPKLDFLDYRGRAAAKIEDLLDSFEIADPNDIITYVANLLSGTFKGMSYRDYAFWKEQHGLATVHNLDKRGHYWGTAQMKTVEFYPDSQLLKSAELTTEPFSKYGLSGLDVEMYLGRGRYSLDFNHGNVEFAEDQSIKRIWGGIKFDHHDHSGECVLSFADRSSAVFDLKDRQIQRVSQGYGVEAYNCVESSYFIRTWDISFDGQGKVKTMWIGSPADSLKDPNYKYSVEIMDKDGEKRTYYSGDIVTIENRRVVSSKRFNE